MVVSRCMLVSRYAVLVSGTTLVSRCIAVSGGVVVSGRGMVVSGRVAVSAGGTVVSRGVVVVSRCGYAVVSDCAGWGFPPACPLPGTVKSRFSAASTGFSPGDVMLSFWRMQWMA